MTRKPSRRSTQVRPPPPPPPPKRTAEEQEQALLERRKREATRKRLVSTGARDIAPIPEVVNPGRRAEAAASFRAFCEVYFPEIFNLGWSDDHLRVIAKIERAVLLGGLFAMAMPRGAGKSSIAETAAMWAALFGHRSYVVIIGSDEGAAALMLDSIKTSLETNDLLLDDFPAVCYPIRCLEGIAHRAGGQLCDGVSTRIGWTAKELVLPTIRNPDRSRASTGAIIQVAGITGRIRGMAYKRPDGSRVRPDLVIIDDPQSDESAKSPSQCQARLAVLKGAVLGLAGPGKKIAGVMPCTVIKPGDMADKILDPQKNPEWNGERTKLVYAWPTNAKLWDEYARIRGDSLRATGSISAATEFYRKNREAMDAGAKVAWPARFDPDELSAIQNAMNLRLQDEAAFFAEYQNDPLPDANVADEELTPDLVASRLSGLPQGVLPPWVQRVTGFIDVSGTVLWWGVCAWDDSCDGSAVDYGAYPDQARPYFTLRDAKITLAQKTKGGLEAQLFAGLEALTGELFGRTFRSATGAELRIERMLIDANWGQSTDVVYDFCRRSPHAALLLPSHGRGVGAASQSMSEWKRLPGERIGHNWRLRSAKRGLRAVIYDTNAWKSWLAARFLTAPGEAGNFTLFGKDPNRHRMLADQVTAEHRVRTTGRGRTVDEWRMKPGRPDNHFLDVLTGCAVAASIQGMPPAPTSKATGRPGTAPPSGKSDRMSFAALQRAAREKRSA